MDWIQDGERMWTAQGKYGIKYTICGFLNAEELEEKKEKLEQRDEKENNNWETFISIICQGCEIKNQNCNCNNGIFNREHGIFCNKYSMNWVRNTFETWKRKNNL